MTKISRNSKGFTLIELLIVIAIIGILAAIAIPAYTGYTKKAKVAGVIHSMGSIKTALAAYYTEKGNCTFGADLDIPGVSTTLGVSIPTQYVSGCTVTQTSGVITCTFANIGSGVDTTTLILTPDNTFKTWAWSGTVPLSYKPKN